jgi:hypothetical protein
MVQDDAGRGTVELMKFSELVNLSLAFHNRVDTLWQRVLYTHAGIVGVMIFFATSQEEFIIPRILVFFFYSLNAGITVFAFQESYAGLRATLADLKSFPGSKGSLQTQAWINSRNYHQHAPRRVFSLGLVWLAVSYLILYPIADDFVVLGG